METRILVEQHKDHSLEEREDRTGAVFGRMKRVMQTRIVAEQQKRQLLEERKGRAGAVSERMKRMKWC